MTEVHHFPLRTQGPVGRLVRAYEFTEFGLQPAPARLRPAAPTTSSGERSGACLEFVLGDITLERTDAIVSPSCAQLVGGGLVNLAVHRAGGPELAEACYESLLASERPFVSGDAVITKGYELPARFVIHSVMAPYRAEEPEWRSRLAVGYRRALEVAGEQHLTSVSFPSLGTGAFGHPVASAAPVAIAAVLSLLGARRMPSLVRFVVQGEAQLEAYLAAVDAYVAAQPLAAKVG